MRKYLTIILTSVSVCLKAISFHVLSLGEDKQDVGRGREEEVMGSLYQMLSQKQLSNFIPKDKIFVKDCYSGKSLLYSDLQSVVKRYFM